MKIYSVTFERRQQGWLCSIGFQYTSYRQFTDEYQVVEVMRKWWLTAYFAARSEVRFFLHVHEAKKGEREAKGWAP